MKNTKVQIAALIIALGLFFSGYQYYEFVQTDVARMKAERSKLEGDLAKQKGQLKRLQDFAQNIEKIKQELRELNVQLESALEYMPPTFDLSGILRKLTMIAQNSGVEIASFRPDNKEEAGQGSFYRSTSITFELRGPYTQTVAFLDQLSRLKRIVNVEELKIVSSDRSERTGTIVANTTAKVKTYRFAE